MIIGNISKFYLSSCVRDEIRKCKYQLERYFQMCKLFRELHDIMRYSKGRECTLYLQMPGKSTWIIPKIKTFIDSGETILRYEVIEDRVKMIIP